MDRSRAMAVAFVAIAPFWGFGAAAACDALALEPAVAAAATMPFVATFAWMERRVDVARALGLTIVVAYAFVGLAIARVPGTFMTTMWMIGPLADKWPVVLLAGIPFALIVTVIVGVPIALVPVHRRIDPHADDALWTFVKAKSDLIARE